ncbi:MAG TPA: response regulator transcription factor [Euzebya sp.]|nr:response regulator transcription factor [Euzebya sp.]
MNSVDPHAANRLTPQQATYAARTMPKIMVVEDEPAIVDALEYGLGAEGFDVVATSDGMASLTLFQRERPDLVLLDVMLPGMSGIEVCKQLRTLTSVPIIMLTARDSEVDKVVGLELGADDYITKPFSMRELAARVRAVLRRGGDWDVPDMAVIPEIKGVRIDPERHEVHVRGAMVDLPPKEFALLELLVRNAGRVMTRDLIIDRIWGADYVGDTKTLDVHIKRIRGRIEAEPRNPELVITVRGVGYKFND